MRLSFLTIFLALLFAGSAYGDRLDIVDIEASGHQRYTVIVELTPGFRVNLGDSCVLKTDIFGDLKVTGTGVVKELRGSQAVLDIQMNIAFSPAKNRDFVEMELKPATVERPKETDPISPLVQEIQSYLDRQEWGALTAAVARLEEMNPILTTGQKTIVNEAKARLFEIIQSRPKPITGLRIVTTPHDSDIYVNNANWGQSPVERTQLPEGVYTVRVTKPGYIEQRKEVVLKTGSRETLSFDLQVKPKKGRLYVHTSPAGARVRVMNIKPRYFDGIRLPEGNYHIRVDKKGYAAVDKWVFVGSGQEKKVQISLTLPQSKGKDAQNAWKKAIEQSKRQGSPSTDSGKKQRIFESWKRQTNL